MNKERYNRLIEARNRGYTGGDIFGITDDVNDILDWKLEGLRREIKQSLADIPVAHILDVLDTMVLTVEVDVSTIVETQEHFIETRKELTEELNKMASYLKVHTASKANWQKPVETEELNLIDHLKKALEENDETSKKN
jgi:hypothetical protein